MSLFRTAIWGACAMALMPGARAAGFECLMEPWQVIEIRSTVEGLIERVNVQRGDNVRRGQPLVELHSNAERAAVESAAFRAQMQGRIASARNRVEYAQKKLKRATELSDEKFVSGQAKDEAEAELRLAESEQKDALETRELAKIEHRRAQELLNMRTMHSPVFGVVVERLLNVGDVAESGSGRKPILKVAQIDPLRVEVVMPLEAMGKIKVGMAAQVQADGVNGVHNATVRVVDRVFDAASATFGVRLELPNPGGTLPGGMRCSVEFAGLKGLDTALRKPKPR